MRSTSLHDHAQVYSNAGLVQGEIPVSAEIETELPGQRLIGSSWHVAVLVPARDEEQLLPRCLGSIARARVLLPVEVTSDLVVAIDHSTDASFALARQLVGRDGVVVETNAGCVGTARALAARTALRRYSGSPQCCWFANTDADCEVPETWLLDQLLIAQKGYAGVAGIVDVDSFEDHDAFVPDRFRRTYLIHSDGSHPHVHGANLGVRADAYLAAGGWSELQNAEDHDLWDRLDRPEHRRLSDARLKVMTSGRRFGRAPHGFADALAAHNETAR